MALFENDLDDFNPSISTVTGLKLENISVMLNPSLHGVRKMYFPKTYEDKNVGLGLHLLNMDVSYLKDDQKIAEHFKAVCPNVESIKWVGGYTWSAHRDKIIRLIGHTRKRPNVDLIIASIQIHINEDTMKFNKFCER